MNDQINGLAFFSVDATTCYTTESPVRKKHFLLYLQLSVCHYASSATVNLRYKGVGI